VTVPPEEVLVEAPELEPVDEPEELDEPLPLELRDEPDEPPLEPPEEPDEPPLELSLPPEEPDDPLPEPLAAPEEPEPPVLAWSQLSEAHSTKSLRPQLKLRAHTAHKRVSPVTFARITKPIAMTATLLESMRSLLPDGYKIV
jgi:hypothetical protein